VPNTPPRLLTPRFLLLTTGMLLYITSAGMQIPTLPLYVTDRLGGSEIAAGVVAGAYYFSAFFLRPFLGRLGDLRGRRILLIGGSLVAAVTSAALAFTGGIGGVMPLRLLGGIGEAALFVAGLAAIDDISPPERRGEAVAVSTLSIYLGLAIGPPLGEWIAATYGFDATWYISAVVALAGGVAFWPVGETRRAITEPPRFRLIHPAGLLTGAVLLGSSLGFAGYSAFLKLYSQELGLASAGWLFILYSLTLVAFRLAGRQIPDRLGAQPTARMCLLASTLGLAMMSIHAVWALVVGSLVLAIGQSLTFPALVSMTVQRAPESERANALATYTGFLDISFGIGPILVGVLAASAGYDMAFLGAAGFAGAAYVLLSASTRPRGSRLRRRRAADVPAPGPRA
jgi:MFS family permease